MIHIFQGIKDYCKDCWHLPPETPDVFRVWQILVIYEAGDQREFMTSNEFSWRTVNRYVNRWCYVDDLLALETENKDLSDKIGKLEIELDRTKKQMVTKCNQLGIAVDALETFAQIPQPIAEVAKVKLYAIKELEQKD